MCGICGHLDNVQKRAIDTSLLQRMTVRMQHRGPDSEGYYIKDHVGLAMRRLAVIDIAGGAQPMTNEDKSVVVVSNGEIYNFPNLRKELLGKGHSFATRSDTEVLVHGYEEWGDSFVEQLDGMFALALWDRKRSRLFLARDHMGQKPLYWNYSAEGLVWASSARALLTASWIEAELDPVSLYHYLRLQYVPDPKTIFSSIYRLPAGHRLIVEDEREPQISRWWKLRFFPKVQLSEREAIAEGREVLRRSVKKCLISDVPLGVFLSGGLDSSVVTALMVESNSSAVKSFSIDFKEKRFSEARFAHSVAERCGTEHNTYVFEPGDLAGLIAKVVQSLEEPLADPALLPLYELARQARREVVVALTGDGGDETLAGYQRYQVGLALRLYRHLPCLLTEKIVPACLSVLPESMAVPEDKSVLLALRRLGQAVATDPRASMLAWSSYFSHEQALDLCSSELRNKLSCVSSEELIGQAYDDACADNWLDRTLYADHLTYLSGDLLPKTDLMTMAHSLEARAPFLTKEWVEWSARLPVRFKTRQFTSKWLLRKAFRDLLPADITKRGKQGFSIPVGLWIKEELKEWALDCLVSESELSPWFSEKAVRRLFDEHLQDRANHGKRLWTLLSLSFWLKSLKGSC